MHKKLASELTSIAHEILRIKDKNDVFLLKERAYEIYEKLAVLAYVEKYLTENTHAEISKEEIIEKIKTSEKLKDTVTSVEENTIVHTLEITEDELVNTTDSNDKFNEKATTDKTDDVIDDTDDFKTFERLLFDDPDSKNDVRDVGEPRTTLEDELADTISVDVTSNLFEKTEYQKTVNDQFQKLIQIGLNDRIAFVKHLFNGDQANFNRVLSQLNTFNSEKEAKSFIKKMVKPDYDWENKEEYEARFMEIVERKFA